MGVIPDFATHYYLPGRRPFLNLSDLSDQQVTPVMAELIEQRERGTQHRRFGRTYMAMRRVVEERLRERFIDAGGRPTRASPHYFVLGESAWFRGLAARMQEVRVSLSELPDDQTSVTYPDSFAAMEVGAEFGLPSEHRPYHRQVFRLGALPQLIDQYGLPDSTPDDDYTGYELRSMDKYIEVQLWADEPVAHYLSESGPDQTS